MIATHCLPCTRFLLCPQSLPIYLPPQVVFIVHLPVPSTPVSFTLDSSPSISNRRSTSLRIFQSPQRPSPSHSILPRLSPTAGRLHCASSSPLNTRLLHPWSFSVYLPPLVVFTAHLLVDSTAVSSSISLHQQKSVP